MMRSCCDRAISLEHGSAQRGAASHCAWDVNAADRSSPCVLVSPLASSAAVRERVLGGVRVTRMRVRVG